MRKRVIAALYDISIYIPNFREFKASVEKILKSSKNLDDFFKKLYEQRDDITWKTNVRILSERVRGGNVV